MRTAIPLTVATALACSLASAPAHARARTFVASYGNDANPCTFGSPCKTFQVAVNAVDAGGEVTAIDSAGFGPVEITKAVTITSPEGVEAGIAATGIAVDINAGPSDAVVLRGLTLNGAGTAQIGIYFRAAGSLTVSNCVVENFDASGGPLNGSGILIAPTSGTANIAITNTIVSHNTYAGINFYPFSGASFTVNFSIDHVVANNNAVGFNFDANGATGATVDIAISNSIASNNGIGIFARDGSYILMSIDNVTMNGNTSYGIFAAPPTAILLSRSVIQGNSYGIANATSNTFYTYGNNLIDRNYNGNISSPLNTNATLR
jgi:hypothetical protein